MKILVVDDDPMAAEMTAAFVEAAGHEPLLAENGVEALERLAAVPEIGLIISDLNMPLVSGLELFRELRSQGLTLPFILLTGDDPAGAQSEEPGLDACLLKDFSLMESLAQTVDEVLARHRG